MRNSFYIAPLAAVLISACGVVASIGGGGETILDPFSSCGEGALSATCLCGDSTYSTGYCCSGTHQAGACTVTPTCGQGAVSSACLCGGSTVSSGYCCGGLPQSTACSAALIVDHRAVQAFSRIPSQWLTAAKALTLHYAHTSHGSQIISGLGFLEAQSSQYSFAVREGTTEGLPSAETPAALRIYDGNAPETYIEPADYWDSTDGLTRTRAVASTGSYDYSMWSWCGQMSWIGETDVRRYVSTMQGLEGQYPSMRFILMTGHSYHSADSGTAATTAANNTLLRTLATQNGMVLFDFQDIESHDPDGNSHPDTIDGCDWCKSWCDQHPADCTSLPSSCAHSPDGDDASATPQEPQRRFNCVVKARAFWWMMARLAGWDGN